MNALITYKSVLANVKQMLRLPNSDNDIWLMSIILQKARDLSTNETLYMENCTVTVENNKFYLPDDCKKIVAFRSKNGCIPGVFVDVPFFKQSGCSTAYPSLVNIIDIDGRWANLINKVEDGTEIEIAYLKVWTMDGDTVINEEMYSALSYKTAAEFALAYVENYTPEQRNKWEEMGRAQADRVRALAGRRKFEESKQQIRSIMTSMVNTAAPWGMYANQWNSFYFPTK